MRFPPGWGTCRTAAFGRRGRALATAALALAVLVLPDAPPASAQIVPTLAPAAGGDGQMLLQADTIVYDNDRQLVTAEGDVQISHNGYTVLANRVVYNRQSRRLSAEGGVRITDPQGNVTHADSADLTEDLRDGFVRSLRLERAADRTRFSADSAERRPQEVTVFNRGTYTACEPCRDNPERPPLWQVRATRIIHEQREQLIYYEDARLEFFGVPVAYVPFMWSPDSDSPRQSGFLFPTIAQSSRVGWGGGVPYYFALSPFYDLTVTPVYYAQQGLHLTTDWRHALPNGSYRVRLSGIYQLDPNAVGVGKPNPNDSWTWDPGARQWRGGVETWGEFQLTDRWRFGWNIAQQTDIRYFRDYTRSTENFALLGTETELVSTAYVQGHGPRSFFDARGYYFNTLTVGLPQIDRQGYMPGVTPVVDYTTAAADPWLGGEVRLASNFTHISRLDAMAYRVVGATIGDTRRWIVPGFAGDYTRLSLDLSWRRTFTDVIGQQWTPFFRVRGDVFNVDPTNRIYTVVDFGGPAPGSVSYWSPDRIIPAVFSGAGEPGLRGMPAFGVDYRYPFIGASGPVTHIVEPVAQVIVRPNEQRIGQLPNEDAQSLVFDDTNLFSVSRFSGYDRIEGGSRANVGLRYTAQTTTGFLVSALFGQSFHLAGLNSFAQGARDVAGTGVDSGLDTARSDYVARLQVRPLSNIDVTARFRFDERDFSLNRLDLAAFFTWGPLAFSTAYTNIGPQPVFGVQTRIESIALGANYRLNENWSVSGGATYSLQNVLGTPGLATSSFGLRYNDDCFTFTLDWVNVYARYGDLEAQTRVVARITLRTLGEISTRGSLDNLFSGSGSSSLIPTRVF
jgi:LPS-assembly protein